MRKFLLLLLALHSTYSHCFFSKISNIFKSESVKSDVKQKLESQMLEFNPNWNLAYVVADLSDSQNKNKLYFIIILTSPERQFTAIDQKDYEDLKKNSVKINDLSQEVYLVSQQIIDKIVKKNTHYVTGCSRGRPLSSK